MPTVKQQKKMKISEMARMHSNLKRCGYDSKQKNQTGVVHNSGHKKKAC